MSFDALWDELLPLGRVSPSGGYRRFAWTPTDLTLREWFAAAADARGLAVTVDRAGNQWAWWGDPDATPGVVAGSHLDSVPDGGAFDGPLGVVSALVAVDALRRKGFVPSRPVGVVNFADEEGARFGVACAGSRLLTGALAADRALALRDGDGVPMGSALRSAGRTPESVGRDDEALRRVATFVELHVEQGSGLAGLGAPVGVALGIWPHGRWRVEIAGEANHAGTTQLADRHDPMLAYARLVLAAREAASRHGGLATCGKVYVVPNGVNAIASHVTAWVDARAPRADSVRAVVAELSGAVTGGLSGAVIEQLSGAVVEESWTDGTAFDPGLRARIAATLGGVPALATGAGHDAGILAAAGIPTGMLFVRNPTGVSHSPAESASRDDCLAGVEALTAVLAELAR
jgi:beta-ureidopropionase / N-carbamoyl-L-amino-acid hydrolase